MGAAPGQGDRGGPALAARAASAVGDPGVLRISRPDLGARIDRGLRAGTVLLVAGAGYGKTEALRGALDEHGWSAAWVRCGELDRDPGHLLGRLMRAIDAAVPGAARSLQERLFGGAGPLDPVAGAELVAGELAALAVDPLAIVLDDAEALAGHGTAERLVATLIASQAGSLAIAVASRRPLAVRAARLRAAGRLAELGPADLLFGAGECAALLALAWGRQPEPGVVERIMVATEGWPLGVALAMRADEVLPGPAPDGYADDYLVEEVIGPLPAELRAAAHALALADEVDAGLAAALEVAEGELGQLCAHGVLAPVAGATGRFAFHPLLRSALRGRLDAELGARRLAELRGALAGALAARGTAREAIPHWLAAGRAAEALAAIEAEGPALARTTPDLLAGWLAALPGEQRAHPAARLAEALLLRGRGRFDEAMAALRDTAAGYRAAHDPAREWAARSALADACLTVGDYPAVLDAAAGWQTAPPEAGPFAATTACFAGAATGELGRASEALELFERLARLGPPIEVLALLCRALIDVPAGRIDPVLASALEAARGLEGADPAGIKPVTYGGIAEIYTHTGQDGEAVRWWRRTAAAARALGEPGYAGAIAAGALAYLLARERRTLREAEQVLAGGDPGAGLGWRGFYLPLGEAAIAAARGDGEAALERGRETLALVRQGTNAHRAWAAVAVASLWRTTGSLGEAGRCLAEARAALDERRPGAQGAYPRALLLAESAAVNFSAGREECWELLGSAWDEAGAAAAHVVRERWRSLEPLLAEALTRGALPAAGAVAAIESAFPGEGRLALLAGHPLPEVRAAAAEAAVASGNPEALARLEDLEGDPDAGVAEAARSARLRLARTPPPLRFRALGEFAVRRGHWRVEPSSWRRPIAQRLVRLLVTRVGEPVPEDDLFEALWPGKAPDAARRALQVAVSDARAVLDVPGAEASVLEARERRYRLRLRPADRVDWVEFDEAARAALAARGTPRAAALRRAAALWAGEPLPEERYEPWAIPWRERLIDRQSAVLAALVGELRAAGDLAGELEAARDLVELDPLNEGAQRDLIKSLARAGRRADALRQYLACRRVLVEGLGVEPGAETTALQARILAGEEVRA